MILILILQRFTHMFNFMSCIVPLTSVELSTVLTFKCMRVSICRIRALYYIQLKQEDSEVFRMQVIKLEFGQDTRAHSPITLKNTMGFLILQVIRRTFPLHLIQERILPAMLCPYHHGVLLPPNLQYCIPNHEYHCSLFSHC